MAYIVPVLQNDDIKIIETTDIMLGGKGNIANMQAQQLINRLLYIEKYIGDYLNEKSSDNINYLSRVINNTSLLSTRIALMKQHSDVSAVVYTYTDLLAYDTSKLYDNNVIKVITDETHDYYCTYYRWHESTDTFSYIGYEKRNPFYVVSEDSSISIDDETTILVNAADCNLTLICNIQGIVIRIVNTVPYYLNSNLVQPGSRTYMYLNGWVEYNADSICNQIYLPIGSVVTTLSTDDMSNYKGVWTKIASGYAIMSSVLTDTALTTGGNDTVTTTPVASCASHSLTTAEIPAHSFSVNSWSCAAGGSHGHTYGGRYIASVATPSSTKTATFYYNTTGTNATTSYSGNHSHGQGSAYSAYQGSGTGHSHTITFSSVTFDIHQKMLYVYVWRRTA